MSSGLRIAMPHWWFRYQLKRIEFEVDYLWSPFRSSQLLSVPHRLSSDSEASLSREPLNAMVSPVQNFEWGCFFKCYVSRYATIYRAIFCMAYHLAWNMLQSWWNTVYLVERIGCVSFREKKVESKFSSGVHTMFLNKSSHFCIDCFHVQLWNTIVCKEPCILLRVADSLGIFDLALLLLGLLLGSPFFLITLHLQQVICSLLSFCLGYCNLFCRFCYFGILWGICLSCETGSCLPWPPRSWLVLKQKHHLFMQSSMR